LGLVPLKVDHNSTITRLVDGSTSGEIRIVNVVKAFYAAAVAALLLNLISLITSLAIPKPKPIGLLVKKRVREDHTGDRENKIKIFRWKW
jgi:hypothetical protein